jgi:hypothetical protein
LATLQTMMREDKGRLEELRKGLVYRGEDNIQEIKVFYLYLIS